MEKEEFKKIEETIPEMKKKEATERVLKQRKFEKINYLKHKSDNHRNQKHHNPQQYKIL